MSREILIGIIGAILLIGGIGGIIWSINNPAVPEKDDNNLLLPFGMAVVGFLIFGLI